MTAPPSAPAIRNLRGAHHGTAAPESSSIHAPFQVGKYLVSPLTRPTAGGRFAASVSIRTGSGSMTHDRVLRFVPVFDTPDQATRFAADQALAWIAQPGGHCTTPNTPEE